MSENFLKKFSRFKINFVLLTNIKRIMKSGFINFWRNGWVSIATVLVMTVTLFTVGSLIFVNLLLNSTINRIEEKVDVTVYFNTDAPEANILSLKRMLLKLDEVESVEYVTREEALQRFKEKHKDNSLINQSLAELDDNPLGASFNIKAKNPNQYASISRFLESDNFNNIIDKYRHNKLVISRLSNIVNSSKKIGLSFTIFMTAIALLVSFNTIRLAIYTNREEISIMRLVGASNNYIRGPFIIEGALYGVFAAVLTMIILYPATFWLASKAQSFFGPPNIFSYYLANFFEIFGLLFLIGVCLGSLSSLIAVRRYLKI